MSLIEVFLGDVRKMDNNKRFKEIVHETDCKKLECVNMAREGD
jgi:hypothetical protein